MSSADRLRLARRLNDARTGVLRLLAGHVGSRGGTEWAVELLGEIDEALWRLVHEPRAFGRCARCGHVIARRRLELVPWTRVCRADAV